MERMGIVKSSVWIWMDKSNRGDGEPPSSIGKDSTSTLSVLMQDESEALIHPSLGQGW